MFKLLGVDAVRLLTNNPKKVEILTEAGINISERVPLIVGRNPKNERYLATKAAKMGHLLDQK
jgi:GTP cyclohydrolase II